MPTSGTYTWGANRAQVRQDALEMVGGNVSGETNAAVNASADSSLNALIKALNANKTDVHVIVATTLNTVANDGTYQLDAGVIGIDGAYVSVGGSDYSLQPITKDQFYAKANKSTVGRPSEFYHDIQAGTLYLYPVPDAVYSVTYGKISQYQDMTDDEQTFDFPASAMEMLTFGLAHRLSIKRGYDIASQESLRQNFRDAEKRYIVSSYAYTKGEKSTSTMVV